MGGTTRPGTRSISCCQPYLNVLMMSERSEDTSVARCFTRAAAEQVAIICCSGSKVVIITGDGFGRARGNVAERVVAAAQEAQASSITLVSSSGAAAGLGSLFGAFGGGGTPGNGQLSKLEQQVRCLKPCPEPVRTTPCYESWCHAQCHIYVWGHT